MKGRTILFVKDDRTRPSKQIVREAVFDSLRGWVGGKKVIEFFAGTGAMGIEAVSHGAESVLFLESEKKAAELIIKNLQRLGIEDKGIVRRGLAERKIADLQGSVFDLAIIDPPYDYPDARVKNLLRDIVRLNLLAQDGVIVLERKWGKPALEIEGIELEKSRRYGKTEVVFMRRAQ